jgi:hypothetical protein
VAFPLCTLSFWTYTTACLINVYYICCYAWNWWANTLLRTWLDVLPCYLVQPCLSNALGRLLLSFLNVGMVISWLWNATQFRVWNVLMFKDNILYNLNGTWRATQDNSTTTVHMALA